MADLLRTEVLRIIIDAQNRTAAGLASASRDVEGFSARMREAGKASVVAGAGLAATSVGLFAGIGKLVDTASTFDSMLSRVQANTTMTNADMTLMRTGIMQLSASTGTPLEQLAAGFQHVTNMGFSAADAMRVLTEANKSARSTGSDTGDVANVLATQMHEFGMRATDAAHAMNVLHLASAESNTTLDQYVESTSKAVAMGANLGVSFTEVNAALSALGRHMDISQASTALAGEMVKMVANTKGAMKEIGILSQKTGIDLVGDFTKGILSAGDFTKIQADLAAATRGNAGEMLKLVAATRGGLSALVLAGTGAQDYRNVLSDLTDTMAGRTDPTMAGFIRQQQTLQAQQERVQRALNNTAIVVGEQLIPVVERFLNAVTPLLTSMEQWAAAHAKLIAVVLPAAAIITGIAGATLLFGGSIMLLVAALNPITAAIVAAALAASALAIAWQSNWRGLRPLIEEGARLVLVLGAGYGLFRLVTLAVTAYRVANELLALAILAVRIGMVQETLAAVAARVALVAGSIATAAITAASWLFAGAMAVVKDRTILWTGAQWLLNVALDANPLGLVIIAVAALTAGVIWAYQNVGWFRDLLNGLWSFISGTLLSGIGTLAHFLGDVLGGAINFAYNALRGFLELLSHIPGVSIHLPPLSSAQLTAGSGGLGAGATGTGGAFRAGLGGAPVLAAAGGGLAAGPIFGSGGAFLAAQAAAQGAGFGGGFGGAGGSVPGISGAGGGSGPSTQVNITVTVGAGAVNVSGDGGRGGLRDYGVRVGEAIADAIAEFARAEQSVSAGANVLLPGARG